MSEPLQMRLHSERLEDRTTPSTFTVTNLNPSGPGSLLDAINRANTNPGADFINFTVSGTIQAPPVPGSGGQEASIYPYAYGFNISSDLTIVGPGTDLLNIQGTIAFWVQSGSQVRISGLTVQNSRPEGNFGAITNYGDLTLDRVVMSNISASGMGAILTTGNLTVSNSTFRNNRDGYYSNNSLIPSDQRPLGGAGISIRGGMTSVKDSLFDQNSAYWSGGAINVIGGTLNINRSLFTGNSAATTLVEGSGYSDFHNGRFGGGAIYAERSTLTINNSTFNRNTSGVAGGAIQLASGATATLTNVTIAGNSAAGNSPSGWGGGIGLGSAPAPVLRNTVVASNILSQGSSPNLPDDYTGTLGTGSVNNLIGANPSGTVGNGQNGNRVGTRSNPIDPLLNALGDNGGPTLTMMPMPGSPLINTGSNSAANSLTSDQRDGNYVRVFNGTVDIGAVEVQTQPPPPPPVATPGAILIGGTANGTAMVMNQSNGGYSPAGSVTFFPGFAGTVRTAMADVTGDSIPDYIGGAGPGGGPRVSIIDGATGARLADFFSFESTFSGGVFVTASDLDGDGRAEFVVTPDQGGGPRVSIYSFNPNGTISTRGNFFGIDDINFRGGARAALGDVNRDGVPDLTVAAGFLGGPRVALFDGRTLFGPTPNRLVGDFFAFSGSDVLTLRNGVYLAAGDVDGDGYADVIAGGGPGGGPRILAISGKTLLTDGIDQAQASPVMNFFVAGNSADRGGVRLATTNADGDRRVEVIVGSGQGAPSRVRIYLGKNITSSDEPTIFQDLDPFGAIMSGGVFVG